MLRAEAVALSVLLSFTLVSRARAEPATGTDASAATAGADELAAQAYSAYSAGKFSEAIALYLKLYDSTGSPAALLNVATIYDRNLHEREVAIEYYRRYLRAPNAEADRVKKVNERLAAIKGEPEGQPQTTATPQTSAAATPASQPAQSASSAERASPAATHASESSGGTGRVIGVVTGSVGLASLAASGVLSLMARSRNSDANKYCDGKVCSDARGVELAHQAGDFATAATVTFASGAALLGTGVAIYLLSSGKERPEAAAVHVSPFVSPAGSGLSVFGKF